MRTKHKVKSTSISTPAGRDLRRLVPSHRTSARLARTRYEIVQAFRDKVRKRPSDSAWLIKYGKLARASGLSYEEAFSVVKDHLRKLRGNVRLKWVHQGLRQGYGQIGLTA